MVYARAVRAAKDLEYNAHMDMLEAQVRSTQTGRALEYWRKNATSPEHLKDLEALAAREENAYLAKKQDWYKAVDNLEKVTKRYENFIKFGQYEIDGGIAPDPETADHNLDPEKY